MKTRIGSWRTLGTLGKASGPANRAKTALAEVTGQKSGGHSSATGFSSQARQSGRISKGRRRANGLLRRSVTCGSLIIGLLRCRFGVAGVQLKF